MNFLSPIAFSSAALAGVLGFGVLFQARRSLPQWLFALGMLALSAESALSALGAEASSAPDVAYWQAWQLVSLAFLPGLWVGFSFLYARGASAPFLSRPGLPLAIAILALPAVAGFWWDSLVYIGPAAGPGTFDLRLGQAGKVLHTSLLLGAVLILVNLERTYRSAVGTMRWRIKFMVIGLAVLFTARAYTSSQALLFSQIDFSLQVLNSGALLLGGLLAIRTLMRTGHFEVTVYPSQQVLQNSFTILLAGIYLFIVGVLAKIVAHFGGESGFQLQALVVLVALIVLALLLLSDRVRLHTKRIVSRHFQRPLYDYRIVWRRFTEGTARKVDSNELCAAIIKLLSEIFEVLSVNLWLVDEKKRNLVLAGSTVLTDAGARNHTFDPAAAQEVMRILREHPDPIDIDASTAPWATTLRLSHPEQFRHGANRVCVPLISGDELLGFITLGDRVGRLEFSLQDYDLLKAVGDQVSASILNIQLAQKLSQAKQLEAFQAMSAFFVHDLKNTASTLSLMLQNLPVHYNDPNFREDALRGISKTVAHINEVISRLSVLRHELAIKPVECDLNELLSETLKTHEQAPGVQFSKELQPLPKLRVDPGQIQKVITNLLLNAREALGPAGEIRVQTEPQNGWAVVQVSDNGCGMSPDFINNRLFRPFETTKKKGIGIGMFHCKMIVEAHRGRIEVESHLGKGTVFRVLLPMGL